jgi:3-hydroxyacyl-CoA dehydrogenase
MGARIAAHVANAGFPVLLLDMVPETGARNALAERALDALVRTKPAALADASFAARVTIGNFDDDLKKLKDCDWVIEAVAENLAIKRSLLARVAEHVGAETILTTNTSGLPVAAVGSELPVGLRRRWFGTHFFNPPRYMRLLEVIAAPETDAAALAAITRFAEVHLGKTVVPANDTPNFIANRIGTFALLNTFRLMQEQGLGLEQVDVLTGSVMGWPKTGTFRLADMVGIDVLAHVARNFAASAHDERSDVTLPDVISQMVERGWLGDKAGQGFYRKQRDADGQEQRLKLDLQRFDYVPAERPKFAAVEMTKNIERTAERIRTLLNGDAKNDPAARFYRAMLPELWAYSANRIGEISGSVADIDRAMKAGFNWELGPFEMWDAAGLKGSVGRMRAAGQAVPAAAEKLLAAGGEAWYRDGGREVFDPASGGWVRVEEDASLAPVAMFRRAHGVVAENAGAALIDLGDGIACLEFHSKLNTLGSDIVKFVRQTLAADSAAVRGFDGFVITNDAANFSAGANLMQLLLAAQDEEWDEVELAVRQFQAMTAAIKFCPRPVVAAPFGLCLGGGTEVSLHAAARQPHLELYMGLVETSVGLVPAGGGCKEMTLRAAEAAAEVQPGARGDSAETFKTLQRTLETIAMAKVSTSAYEARGLGLLAEQDTITMHRMRVVTDAKARARQMAEEGYTAPLARNDIAVPGEAVLASLELGIHMMHEGGYISDHDVKVARQVAKVLCGGRVTSGTQVSEQYLLDLEREAFLSLCGERRTQERIAFTLKTGKPLRN